MDASFRGLTARAESTDGGELHSGAIWMDAAVDKRALITSAALALFAAKGFEGTAVPEIAALAGVGTGTLYRYFPDKQGLVNALYRHWRTMFNEAVLAPMPARLTPRAQFDLYWKRVLEWYRAYFEPARFLELHAHDAYLDADSRHAARVHGTALKSFIRAGLETGSLARIEPDIAAALLTGAAIGLLRREASARETGQRFLGDETIAAAGAHLWRAMAA
jgi:TetR/AcrR family transcriptional regulator, repressor of fatR-cypB operon